MKDNINACDCQLEALIIPRRHVTLLLASLVAVSFFVFIAGYFFGYSKASSQLCHQSEQEFFSDAIEHSLIDNYNNRINMPDEDEGMMSASLPDADDSIQATAQASSIATPVAEPEKKIKQYQAALFGGTKANVDEFVKNMNNFNLPVEACCRRSKTQKGKEYIWYQAVTKPMADYNKLCLYVEQIKKRGRIKQKIDINEIG